MSFVACVVQSTLFFLLSGILFFVLAEICQFVKVLYWSAKKKFSEDDLWFSESKKFIFLEIILVLGSRKYLGFCV